jgi:hypothetical protein
MNATHSPRASSGRFGRLARLLHMLVQWAAPQLSTGWIALLWSCAHGYRALRRPLATGSYERVRHIRNSVAADLPDFPGSNFRIEVIKLRDVLFGLSDTLHCAVDNLAGIVT